MQKNIGKTMATDLKHNNLCKALIVGGVIAAVGYFAVKKIAKHVTVGVIDLSRLDDEDVDFEVGDPEILCSAAESEPQDTGDTQA